MATIVNTPAHEHVSEESSSGTNLIVGVLIVLVVAFLIFYFGLPLLRNIGAPAAVPQQINNNIPPQGGAAPQLNVPDKVNVDVNAPR